MALDWLRGLVMVLMTLDHASSFFNAGRVTQDSAGSYVAGTVLPTDQFLFRWVTHLCAPSFLFLAGAGLAMSTARRRSNSNTGGLDRDLLIRGALLIALDLLYISVIFQHPVLQVLYAIGLSLVLMVPLRRLPDRALLALAGLWFVAGEWFTGLVWSPTEPVSLPWALSVAPSVGEPLMIIYPVVPWLSIMLLGWVFGRHLQRHPSASLAGRLAALGVLGLGTFAALRGVASYGNMWLQRENHSLAQWLHVSKYPPSLTYLALELGLMALILAALLQLSKHVTPSSRGPLLVFGQTALFFYLAHFALLALGRLCGVEPAGLPRALLASALVLLALYPCCVWYRGLKRAHPDSWLRFI